MTKIEIEFKNIGRQNWSGIKVFDLKEIDSDQVAELAYREASLRVMSRSVEAIYNSMTNEGMIVFGFGRDGGSFKVKNWKALTWHPSK